MTSTRNKNTRNDYCLQQRNYDLARNYNKYAYSQYGKAYNVAMPDIGIIPSYMPRGTLSNNPVEIESRLFGINTTNLVKPQGHVTPLLKTIKTISYFDRIKLEMPEDLIVSREERPFPR